MRSVRIISPLHPWARTGTPHWTFRSALRCWITATLWSSRLAEWLPHGHCGTKRQMLWRRARCRSIPHAPGPGMLRGHTRRGFAGAAERAIADYQRSIQLRGPGISTSSCIHSIGAAHWNAGRFEETIRWVRRALADNPNATWMHRHLSCAAAKLGDRVTVAHSVDCMRRAQPHLTVSLLVENYPVADPDWLESISRAGLPLT